MHDSTAGITCFLSTRCLVKSCLRNTSRPTKKRPVSRLGNNTEIERNTEVPFSVNSVTRRLHLLLAMPPSFWAAFLFLFVAGCASGPPKMPYPAFLQADELDSRLAQAPDSRNIVVSVLGTTIHGALDDLPAIARVCRARDCWLHVDAIYAAALAFSNQHRARLAGLELADSLAIAPQKWMYVPRVCALLYLRDRKVFEFALARSMPYSQGEKDDRGTWGLQGSRRADAVTLWATLQVLGRAELGRMVDGSLDLAQRFYQMLDSHPLAGPSHRPDLNLQTFRWGQPDPSGERLLALQAALAETGRGWLSVSRWRGESLLRSVLLPSATGEGHLARLLDDLTQAGR